MTTTTAAVTVDMIAVAAIISKSDKPCGRWLAGLRNITHQLGYFGCHRCTGFGRIHRVVAVVIAKCSYGHDHQLANDAAVDHCVGTGDAVADDGWAVRGEFSGNGARRPGGADDRDLFLHLAHAVRKQEVTCIDDVAERDSVTQHRQRWH